MKKILTLLIALLALTTTMVVMGLTENYLGPESNMTTTSSIADFLNDSWKPSSFVAPVDTAVSQNKDKVLLNSTPNIYSVLNDSWQPEALTAPTNTAVWPMKNNTTIATSGYAIYEFLKDDWTPSAAVPVLEQPLYKLHQMN